MPANLTRALALAALVVAFLAAPLSRAHAAPTIPAPTIATRPFGRLIP